MTDLRNKDDGAVKRRGNRSNEIKRLENEKLKIEERLKESRRKRELEIQNGDDYIGSDYSCCMFVPIKLGVTLIGIFSLIESGLLLK